SSEKSKTAKQFNGSSKPEALVDTRTKPDKGKGKAPVPPEEPLPTAYKVIAGSYEKLLYGFEGTISVSESSEGTSKSEPSLSFNLKPIFMFSAHASHITAVAASPQGGKWLATGSADENIKIWDLRRRFEVGGLQHHNGSITHLGFPSRSHLLSASEDGTLCLFRTRDWVVLRVLKGHKARVNSVAVHPTSKVALSVGKDRTVRMWDLMRGRGVASMKLGKEGELIRWSIDGTLSAIQSLATIDVYTIDMLLVHTIAHPSRIHDIKFYKPSDDGAELLLVGAEDRMVSVYTISSDPEKEPTIIARLKGHVNR
ncbi:WD40 repeat-like protein, partial [Fistulina hepatica ATCC 64428]